jgi:hypothetical protein
MTYWLGSLFQRNAHSLPRRLYFAVLPRLNAVFSKRQSVHFVSVNGTPYKRVVLGDSREAELVERALERAPAGAAFPPLIHRHENELLLAFVEGRRFDPLNADDRHALVLFLGALYSAPRTGEATDRLRRRFEVDAAFLNSAGLIDSGLHRALQRRADAVQPAEIEFGLDYTDPVTKNFIVSGEQLFAIDVEGLREDAPIGTAIAKAGVHWLARDERDGFLDAVEELSGDVIRPQFDFIELCFRTGWTKRKLLDGRHRAIRIELLDELVRQQP